MKEIVLSFIILSLMVITGNVFAGRDECEVVDYAQYVEVSGGGGRVDRGGWVDVSIDTYRCVAFTVRNTSGGGRFDPIITATFADGKTKSKKVKSSRFSSDETFSDSVCFGKSEPISSLSCSF